MSLADDFVAAFYPWMTPNLETYLRTIGSMFEETEWYAEDTDDYDGWTVIFDPQRTKAKDLRWLGQIIGERVPVGHPEPLAREWIEDRGNLNRGTLGSILRTTQRHLTGHRIITYFERTADRASVGTQVDHLYIVTYRSETPFPDRTLSDLKSAVPGDIVLHYEVVFSPTWTYVKTNYASWTALKAAFNSWETLRESEAQLAGPTYSRQMPT